jgi:alkanesulfonate monooxygenase SsuD/methylene tetrahydromethanopterin reductase-like flavin-dependent oxidoreductase (luciferase family)
MKYGVFVTMQQRDLSQSSQQIFANCVEQTRLADELGFETAWYPEHHFSNYSLCPSPLLMASHCAAVTKRIRLGAAVLILPLYTPGRLLAEIGLVDDLSNGRLELGVGSGYQKFEFDRLGANLETNKAVTLEMLEVLERGLQDTQFSYEGEYIKQPRTSISARCVQKPYPPIWIATFDPMMMERAVKSGHSIFVTGWLGNHKRLGGIRQTIDQSIAAQGGAPADTRVGLLRFAFCSENRQEVEHYVDCARYQQRLGNALKFRRQATTDGYVMQEAPYDEELPWEKMMANIPVGDPETCAERMVNDIRALRPQHVALIAQIGDMDQKVMLRSMEMWMTKVAPLVEKALKDDAPRADIPLDIDHAVATA